MGDISRFDHDPQGLLEDCAKRWTDERLRAAVVLVTDEQDRLMWDGAAYQKRDLLWMLEKFKLQILGVLD